MNDSEQTQANDTVLVDIPRGDKDLLRLAMREYEGKRYIDLRVWFIAPDGAWKPTGKGTTIRPKELARAVAALERAARDLGVPLENQHDVTITRPAQTMPSAQVTRPRPTSTAAPSRPPIANAPQRPPRFADRDER